MGHAKARQVAAAVAVLGATPWVYNSTRRPSTSFYVRGSLRPIIVPIDLGGNRLRRSRKARLAARAKSLAWRGK